MGESLLDFGGELDQDLTLQIFGDGEEVNLLIKTAERYVSETSGKPSIKLVLESTQFPDTHDDIINYVGLPSDDSPKDRKKKLARLKEFYIAFDIDFSAPITIETDLPGRTGDAIVGVDTYEGNTKNTIKRFQAYTT